MIGSLVDGVSLDAHYSQDEQAVEQEIAASSVIFKA